MFKKGAFVCIATKSGSRMALAPQETLGPLSPPTRITFNHKTLLIGFL